MKWRYSNLKAWPLAEHVNAAVSPGENASYAVGLAPASSAGWEWAALALGTAWERRPSGSRAREHCGVL